MKKNKKTILSILLSTLSFNSFADSFQLQQYVNLFAIKEAVQEVVNTASDISCGSAHCYAIINGTIWSVGSNSKGQLGTRAASTVTSNVWVNTGFTADKVSAGANFGYAMKNGYLYVVGDNTSGQYGIDAVSLNSWFNTGKKVADIAAGGNFGYYIGTDGYAYSSGNNSFGQLARAGADYTHWQRSNFRPDYIVCSYHHAYALSGGLVYSAGENTYGQLAVGNTNTSGNMWRTTGLAATAIGTALFSGYAIGTDGNLMVVGSNGSGELGLGTSNSYYTTWTNTGIKPSGITRSLNSTGYIIKNQSLYASGLNNYGQIGNGTTTNTTNFVYTGILATKAGIGMNSATAINDQGMFSTGLNSSGQLALGDNTNRSSWAKVTSPFDNQSN